MAFILWLHVLVKDASLVLFRLETYSYTHHIGTDLSVLLHVDFLDASLGSDSCKNISTHFTLEHRLRKLYALVIWRFRMHCWFFIRSQDQHTTYQFSELLLTTWLKLAKQVQIYLKYHLQQRILICHFPPPKEVLNVARNTASITSLINFPSYCPLSCTLHKPPHQTNSTFISKN